MLLQIRRVALSAAVLAIVFTLCQPAWAQRGGGAARVRIFLQPAVSIAQLEEVQQELKLSDQQKQQVAALNEELNQQRREAFQNAASDWEKLREEIEKIYQETQDKFAKQLDESQQQRLQEIYLQVNGPLVLQNKEVASALNVTEDQQEKLVQVGNEMRDAFRNAGLRDMSEEEAAKKVDELLDQRDEKMLAVLTEEQRTQLDEMKGETLEVDLSKMPGPGRR